MLVYFQVLGMVQGLLTLEPEPVSRIRAAQVTTSCNSCVGIKSSGYQGIGDSLDGFTG